MRIRLAAVVAATALVLAACGGSSEAPLSGQTPAAGASAPATSGATSASGLQPKGPTVSGVVDRVVDGDTAHVIVDGRDLTVRFVGMNTPETVKPDSPVECFGPESSDYAKQVLTGQPVVLEFDPTQGQTDQYDRTLAYVWRQLPGGGLAMFNLESIAGGYALERQYGPTPYVWKDAFRAAQQQARSVDAGLWGACDYS